MAATCVPPKASRAQHEAAGPTLSPDDFVWLVSSLCQLNRIAADSRLIAREFPPPHDLVTVHDALRRLGFKTGMAAWRAGRIALPCIAFAADGEVTPGNEIPAENPFAPALIVDADEATVLYFRAGSTQAESSTAAEFDKRFQSTVLIAAPDTLKREAAQAAESNGDGAAQSPDAARFGFRWFVPELLKHKAVWRQVILASLAIQIVGLVTPLMTQVIIDKVVTQHTESTLAVVAMALVVFMLFNTAMTWLRQFLVLHSGTRVDAVLAMAVVRHMLRLPLVYFEQRPTGTLVARLQGMEHVRQFISGAAVTLMLDCPFLVVFLAVMFWYSWQLTLIALGVTLLIAGLSFAVTPLFRARLNRQFLLGARGQAFLTEHIAGMATVKSLQMEPMLERKYADMLAASLAAGFDTRTLANTYQVATNMLEQSMTLAILLVGALLAIDASNSAQAGGPAFTVGMLVAFQMFASRMSQPMLRLAGLWQEFQQASVSVHRLGDMMDIPAERFTLTPQRAPGEPQPGRVEFSGVSFRYSEQHPWLFRNLKLTLAPGRLAVLMGPSGCGKSTLAKLLQGFHTPGEGAIRIDGTDIRHLAVNELRGRLGVVPQETVLFSGTVYENLLSANPDADFAQVVRACKQAEIHDTIEQLPQGYQTPLGEHGVGLSGGQRQRIAIARALLKAPTILIFDEATSNLDPQTAAQFANTVNQLKGTVTILFIAHALPRGLAVDDVFRFGTPSPGSEGATKRAPGPQPDVAHRSSGQITTLEEVGKDAK